jgi:hypothetical protein
VAAERNKNHPKTVNELLDCFDKAAGEHERVSLDNLMDAIGRRSFGPLLMLAGLVLSVPGISDIPSVPTMAGLFILIISVQILFGRHHLWLPGWLLRRSISGKRMKKVANGKRTRRVAQWVDDFVVERLRMFAGPRANHLVALVCSVLALVAPLTEFVPLSGIGIGVAMLCFGISLIARDGLMALIGFAISFVTLTLAIMGIK